MAFFTAVVIARLLNPTAVNETNHAIWRIPADKLSWARDVGPVYLKQLSVLEPPELARIREIKHSLRYCKPTLTRKQQISFKAEIEQLEQQIRNAYKPPPRHCLMKATRGVDIPVHRMFVDAPEDQDVQALDSDFLNFGNVKSTVTVRLGTSDGYAGESMSQEGWIPNLRIMPFDNAAQGDFEENLLQYQITRGDIDETPLRVLPNADLGKRTGVEGKIEDCGKFEPLRADEQYSPERFAARHKIF